MSHSNDENLYATKFMPLKPKKMGFFEFFHVLFGRRGLYDRDHGQFHEYIVEQGFGARCYIFLSLLVQKLLHLMANVLNFAGYIVKSFLNAQASHNYNVFMLLFDCILGKQVVNVESTYYVSITGHLDKRFELLDRRIKREDPNKYNAALSVMASKLSYENKAFIHATVVDRWKMMLVHCSDYWNDYQEKTTTHAFIMLDKREDHDTYVVAFTGTELFDIDAWSTSLDVSWLEFPNVGRIHSGYMKALGLVFDLNNNVVGWPKEIENDQNRRRAYYSIRDLLKKRLKFNGNDDAKFILTGHSLGGALAILFLAILMLHEEKFLLERLEGVYTFGQPRVGDRTFANFMAKTLSNFGIKYFRFVYSYDIVPRFPFEDNVMLKFYHFGTCLYYDRSYKGKKMQEEPNKNYFSWKYMITMQVNAFWELVRSFTIVSKYGPEYQESWVLKFVRFFGIVFPGVSCHSIQDYVNITRLGFPSHLD